MSFFSIEALTNFLTGALSIPLPYWIIWPLIAGIVIEITRRFTIAKLGHGRDVNAVSFLVFIAILVIGSSILPQIKSVADQSLPTSSVIYTAPGAETKNTAIDNSNFKNCNRIIDNHGIQDDVYVKNTTVTCPSKNDANPSAQPTDTGPSGFYNAPGATALNTAILNSSVEGCDGGFKNHALANGSVINGYHVACRNVPRQSNISRK